MKKIQDALLAALLKINLNRRVNISFYWGAGNTYC